MKRLTLLGMAVWLSGGCLLDDAGRGAGGAGGTSAGPACESDADCLDDPSICRSSKCLDGACQVLTVNEGTVCAAPESVCSTPGICAEGDCVATQLPEGTVLPDKQGNCRKVTCDAMQAAVESVDNTDSPPAGLCKAGACVDGKPMLVNVANGTACAGGGTCCDGACCDADCLNCK